VTELACNWARGRGSARYLLEKSLSKGLRSLPPPLRRILEAAICRILFEERTPKAIIASRTVEEVKSAFGPILAGMANAVLRRIVNEPPPWPDRETDPIAYLAASTSHPQWIIERWLSRWDFDHVQAQAAWDNQRPAIWLRWNRLRGELNRAQEVIEKGGLEVLPSPDFEGFFKLEGSFYPAAAQLVGRGDFQVQDPSASLAVRLLDPQPNTEIVDLCAAPGGKATLMAELTSDKALVTAVDLSASRLKLLAGTLVSRCLRNIRTVAQDAREFPQDPANAGRFDAVLLDVPCSGFGVLARRADLRWRRKLEDLPELVTLQKGLIRAGSRCVKIGGVLVYSTCSIEPQENQEIVRDFLATYDNFHPDSVPAGIPEKFIASEGEIATDSPRDRMDGAYAARLIRIQ
jgi:16S rRNA (cytosine967-C5)-methyltransferase